MPGMTDDAWLARLLRQGALPDAGVAQELAATLAERDPSIDVHGTATRTLLTALDETWERGWQPADVVHVARREASTGSVPLVVALIGEHARRTDAAFRAPDAWIEQLFELGALAPGDPEVVSAWHRAERRTPAAAWRIVLQLAGLLHTSVRLETLLPPPSRWGPRRSRAAMNPAFGDDRPLRRIRGLLAKAESTEFPEEAEALTAKAQELMTRHAVDAALLEVGRAPADGRPVETRRVHVRDPYVRAKMHLLAAVAEANDVRLVWYSGLGIANLVGGRADVAAVELLFTSLLLQVVQALSAAECPLAPRSASRSFAGRSCSATRTGSPSDWRRPGSAPRRRQRPSTTSTCSPCCATARRRSNSESPSSSRACEPPAAGRRWTRAVGTPGGRQPRTPTWATAGRPCADRPGASAEALRDQAH
jgi:hypothetical protein